MLSASVKRKQLIKRWPDKLATVNKEFLPSAGVIVTGDAKRNLRNNKSVITGLLRSSINYQVGTNEVRVGTNVHYAPHVEYGTVRSKAKPYLRPALDNHRKNLVKLWNSIFRRVYGR